MHTITARSVRRRMERDGKLVPRGPRDPYRKEYVRNGVRRELILHPTKGWRDSRLGLVDG